MGDHHTDAPPASAEGGTTRDDELHETAPQALPRTPLDEDRLRTIGEIAVLAGSIELLMYEAAVVLISPHDPRVGEITARSMSFDALHATIDRLLALQLPLGGLTTWFWAGYRERLLDAMRTRNEILHSAWRWGFDGQGTIVGPPTSKQRRTGEFRLGKAPDLGRLEEAADELAECEQAARQVAFGAAEALGVNEAFVERYGQWMPAGMARRAADGTDAGGEHDDRPEDRP